MTERFQRYPSYVKTNCPHLGSVPENWRLCQLKRAFSSCVNGTWGTEPIDGGDNIVVIRVADFDREKLIVVDGGYTIRQVPIKEQASRLVSRGDLLLEKSGGGEKTPVGQAVYFDKDFPAVCSNFVARISVSAGNSGKYLNYAMACLYDAKINTRSIKQNTGIQNLDSNQYLSELWALPPLEEQTKIAQFLDYETGRIDALIDKQQQLIELLKEKRQAVISYAVTKGLNPDAPMRDSGVEWLGEVPEHWEVMRLKHCCSDIFLGLTSKVDYVEQGGVPLIRASDFTTGTLSFEKARSISIAQHRQLTKYRMAKRNDVLLSKSGSIGTVAIVDTDTEFSIYESVFVLRGRAKLTSPQFLMYLLRADTTRSQYSKNRVGMGVHHLNMSDFVDVSVSLPPIDEQIEIVRFLESSGEKIDELSRLAESQAILLRERRTALISAAVTGKIDVRDWEPPKEQEVA